MIIITKLMQRNLSVSFLPVHQWSAGTSVGTSAKKPSRNLRLLSAGSREVCKAFCIAVMWMKGDRLPRYIKIIHFFSPTVLFSKDTE